MPNYAGKSHNASILFSRLIIVQTMRILTLAVLILSLPFCSMAAENSSTEPVTKTLIWPDGTRYVGGVKDGRRTGKGTIFWQDGTRFVGEFKDDMRNGPGTMILPDGTVYSGLFKDDELVDSALENAITAADQPPVETTPSAISAEAPETKQGETAEIQPSEGEVTLSISDEPIINEPGTSGQDDFPGDQAPVEIMFNEQVTSLTEEVKDELIETIDLWSAAWSDKNVPQYLSNYSGDFRVPGKLSRNDWEKLRRSRLNRPRYISLDVDFENFEFVETNVIDVYFTQSYNSNTFSDITDKILRMRKEGHAWKILAETSR